MIVTITFIIIPDIPEKLISGVMKETKLINDKILKAEMTKNKNKQTSSGNTALDSKISQEVIYYKFLHYYIIFNKLFM